MDITIKEEKYASQALLNESIEKELGIRGYKTLDNWGNVVKAEPIKVENIRGGFLFLRTYHKWWWKVIAKMRLQQQDGLGKYILYITTPLNEDTFHDAMDFIEGLNKRLGEVKESLEIVFIKDAEFAIAQTDDITVCWY